MGIVIVIVIALGWVAFSPGRTPDAANAFDEFAQCLTNRGFTMYGAYWCPHCQNEKRAFGDAWSRVNYVECTEETKRCIADGIKGYPTWLGPDGVRLEGEQGIERLAEASGCAL